MRESHLVAELSEAQDFTTQETATPIEDLEEVRLIAHREAGHAVIATLCNVSFKQVALATPTIPSFRLLRGMAQQYARGIVGLAGGETEHRYLAHRLPPIERSSIVQTWTATR